MGSLPTQPGIENSLNAVRFGTVLFFTVFCADSEAVVFKNIEAVSGWSHRTALDEFHFPVEAIGDAILFLKRHRETMPSSRSTNV